MFWNSPTSNAGNRFIRKQHIRLFRQQSTWTNLAAGEIPEDFIDPELSSREQTGATSSCSQYEMQFRRFVPFVTI